MDQHALSRVADSLPEMPKLISPGMHAVLDYSVASSFFGLWARYHRRHPRAAALACINGCMVLGLALTTNYPGGVFRRLSFRNHRTMDWIQAGIAGLGPTLLGFRDEPEAAPFHSQALSEVGVIATTDWNAATA